MLPQAWTYKQIIKHFGLFSFVSINTSWSVKYTEAMTNSNIFLEKKKTDFFPPHKVRLKNLILNKIPCMAMLFIPGA